MFCQTRYEEEMTLYMDIGCGDQKFSLIIT